MKFAVVEYNSKSGSIWKHTPDKPNYLCDPATEIDPTSFGCYVSALEGEHIPLTGFITGSYAKKSAPGIVMRKIRKRLSGSWPQTYDLSYFQNFDALLVVHQISDGHEVTAFTRRLKQLYPNIAIIGVPTQPYGILQDHWRDHPDAKKDMIAFMDECHTFITIVDGTLKQWQELSQTPVRYMPQPYPVSYGSKHWNAWDKKKKVIFVAGVTERYDIKKGHEVAVQIQKELPEFDIHVTKIDDMNLDTSALKQANYHIADFEPWREHLKSLSETALIINTDFTQTRGRVQVDAAAVGTPSIGADSDGQVKLFPKFKATDQTSVADLVQQGIRLLTDKQLYETTAAQALQALQEYEYDKSAQRIKALFAEIKATA